MSFKKHQAVFLDRDGTIIEDRGHLSDGSQVVFFPDTFDALRRLQQHFKLFIVTNQPGISRGILTHEDVARVHDYILDRLEKEQIRIEEVYYCPHTRDEKCRCIKPESYFLEKAAADHDTDLKRSYVLGDHPFDVHFAESVGATGIYLLTGHGSMHLEEIDPGTIIAEDIARACETVFEIEAQRD